MTITIERIEALHKQTRITLGVIKMKESQFVRSILEYAKRNPTDFKLSPKQKKWFLALEKSVPARFEAFRWNNERRGNWKGMFAIGV